MEGTTQRPDVYTREERCRKFGIDVGDELEWRGWEPGGDYLKKITVRNVTSEARTVKYKLPKSKFFYMEFPSTVKLNPGMSIVVDISFRPIRNEGYDDAVEFNTSLGTFYLPVRAFLPELSFTLPPSIDFGLCPINEITEQTFTLSNNGQIPADYEWQVEAPFAMVPARGHLGAGETQQVLVKFSPTDAAVPVAVVVCSIDNGKLTKSLRISGISKYPFISSSETVVDFGEVLVGRVPERTFVLRNHSNVRASFTLRPVVREIDINVLEPVFAISPASGVIAPNESATLKVTFTPTSFQSYSHDIFEFLTPGGNTARVECCGTAVGPRVRVSTRAVNFGDVAIGGSVTKIVALQNDSDVPAYFQFTGAGDRTADSDLSAFTFSPMFGTITPGLSTSVIITFTPPEHAAINYYKRVFVLIRDQNTQFIDMVATSYDDKRRPAPLRIVHVDLHRKRRLVAKMSGLKPEAMLERAAEIGRTKAAQLGFGLSEDDLEAQEKVEQAARMVAAEKLVVTGSSATEKLSQTKIQALLSAPGVSLPEHEPPAPVQFFLEDSDPEHEIALNETQIAFGSCSRNRASGFKTVTVVNRTDAKVVCVWDCRENDPNTTFIVMPIEQDIRAHSSAQFRIAFRPRQDNFYYAQVLEAQVYHKTNRTFRLVQHDAFVPSTCVRTFVSGNTFAPSAEQFLPNADFNTSRVSFPACRIGGRVYQTIQLTNRSDTPLLFSFPQSEVRSFKVRPAQGCIGAQGFALISFEFCPKSLRPDSAVFSCTMNNNSSSSARIEVAGVGYAPLVELANDSRLFFKPMCQGVVARQTHSFTNLSRLPVRYAWRVPEKFANLLHVQPASGVLKGNETVRATWEFSPDMIKQFYIRVPLEISTDVEPGFTAGAAALVPNPEVQVLTLHVRGECSSGMLVFEPAELDFGSVGVAAPVRQRLRLRNASDCALQYALHVVNMTPDNVATQAATLEVEAAQTDSIGGNGLFGELPAHAFRELSIALTPSSPALHELRVIASVVVGEALKHRPMGTMLTALPAGSIDLSSAVDERLANQDGPMSMSCRVRATASLPLLAVTDIRMDNNTLAAAWTQLNIDRFNKALSEGLSASELDLRDNSANMHSDRVQELIDSLAHVNFDFGVGVIGNQPEIVYVKLQNLGDLDADWSLKFPDELESKAELWVDHGVKSVAQRAQETILENRLFQLSPRGGVLKPGASVVVQCVFWHRVVGAHSIPLLLSIQRGKQMVLMARGQTIDMATQTFSMLETDIDLRSLPIGLQEEQTPAQHYRLVNNSTFDLAYQIDTTPFEQLRAENFGMPIFWCSMPTGIVPAQSTAFVPIYFRPIEARSYECPLIVRMLQAPELTSSAPIKLRGSGLHPLSDTLPYSSQSAMYSAEELPSPSIDPEHDQVLSSVAHAAQSPRPTTASSTAIIPYTAAPLRPVGAVPRGYRAPRFPFMPTMALPGQFAELSVDLADFAVLPLRGVARRLVVVRNLKSRAIEFEWELNLGDLVTVEPRHGIIAAGGRALCSITMRAGASPIMLDRNLSCILNYYTSPEEMAARKVAALSSASASVAGSPPQSPLGRSLVSSRSAFSATGSISGSPPLGAVRTSSAGSMGGFALDGERAMSSKPVSNIQYMRAAQPLTSQHASLRSGGNAMVTHPVSASGAATVAVIHGTGSRLGSALSGMSATMVHSHSQSRSLSAASVHLASPPSRLTSNRPVADVPVEVDIPALLNLRESWTLFLRVCANIVSAEQVYQLNDGEDVMQRCFFPPPNMALPDHAPAGKFEAFEKEIYREESLLLDVMSQLLQDCLHQPQVLHTFDALAPETPPYFVYMPNATHDDAIAAFEHPHALDDVRLKCMDHALQVPEAPALSDSRLARPVPTKIDDVFQQWSETILDSCLFGLLQESLAGEYKLTAAAAAAAQKAEVLSATIKR